MASSKKARIAAAPHRSARLEFAKARGLRKVCMRTRQCGDTGHALGSAIKELRRISGIAATHLYIDALAMFWFRVPASRGDRHQQPVGDIITDIAARCSGLAWPRPVTFIQAHVDVRAGTARRLRWPGKRANPIGGHPLGGAHAESSAVQRCAADRAGGGRRRARR